MIRVRAKAGKIKISLITVFVFLATVTEAKGLDSLKFLNESKAKKHILNNGMTVILERMPESSLVSLTLVVKAGSVTEGKFLGSGISHFVEHMLFKGTKKRAVGQIIEEIESLGGRMDAFTSYDYTSYTITLPQEHFAEGLNILADVVMNSQFDSQELEKEREVIFSEIRLNRDDPNRRIHRLLFAGAYTRHPYQHPIIGYEPLLKALKRQDLIEYYKTMYIPNNMVLSVVGNIDLGEALLKIKEDFKDFRLKSPVLRNLPSEPPQLVLRRIEEQYPTKLSRVFLGFKGVSINNPDLFALDVLAAILGQGQSSRLYREVYKNKQLVYSVETFNFTPLDLGLFAINCTLEKERIKSALEAIFLEIDKLKKQGVSKKELEKARRQVISSYIFSRQTTAAVGRDLAVSEVLTADFDFSRKYVKGVEKVTLDDIQRVAKEYLNQETLTIAILNPIALKRESQELGERKVSKIKKIILDNGLTILLKEDNSYPLVSIQAIFKGGLRAESQDNNGISNLTSRMLLQGTKNLSSEALAETIESLGANIEPFSGNNSFGLSFDLLSRDINKAIELLADIVINPLFAESELQRQKELVLSEIKAQDDSVFQQGFRVLKKELFETHPYRFNLLGTEASIKAIERQDVIQFYNDLVVPNNMVLAVFGDINQERVLQLIKDKFSQLKPKKLSPLYLAVDFPQHPKELILATDKEQTVVMIGFPGVKLTSPDRYSLEVIDTILSSMSGRLFRKIREELGKSYALGGSSVPGVEAGLYYIYVSTTFQNLEKVREIILDEIKQLHTSYVEEQELSRAKAYLYGSQKRYLQTYSALALKSGLDQLYGLGFDNYTFYQDKISQISPEDIRRVAKSYLNLNKMVTVVVVPKEDALQIKEDKD